MGIRKRITGLVFLLLALTVGIMTWLTDWQMTGHFQAYLAAVHGTGGHMMGMQGMGMHETAYISSVHNGLAWVGVSLLIIGLIASYALAKGISDPIKQLAAAVSEVKEGRLGQRVTITTGGELDSLAEAFNSMSERLETNERLRRRLLADIAHELRTPVTIIQGNLEGLTEGVIEPTKEQFYSLYEEAVHLGRLITDLRDLSLADAGHLPLDKSEISILQIATKNVSLITPLAEEKGIAISVEGIDAMIQADPGRIMQVFRNVLSNAIRYAVAKIDIQIREENGWVEVTVTDDGQGIPEEHIPFLFKHFYRADEVRDRNSGGSGIGLAIVKSIMEAHGGTVSVSSRLGVGTKFVLNFRANSRMNNKRTY